MYQWISKIIIIFTISSGLLACATTANQLEQKLLDEGARPLSPEQVTAYLSGNTERWVNGGAYFKADGTAYIKWAGKEYPQRKWDVARDGKVCVRFLDGQATSCSRYFDNNGEIWVVTLEVFGEPRQTDGGPVTLMEGNRLSEF